MAVSSEHRNNTRKQDKKRGVKRNTTRNWGCYDFLTCRFDDVPAYTLSTVRARCGEINMPALEQKASDFLRTNGEVLEFEHTGDNYHDLVKMIECLKSHTDGYLVEIAARDETEEQSIIAYKENSDFVVESIYFMPVKIVSSVDDKLKDILLDFFAFLDMESPFLKPKDSLDMRYILGIDEDDDYKLDETLADDMEDDFRKLAESYASGEINKVFEEITQRRRSYAGNCKKLTKKIMAGISAYSKNGSKTYTTPSGKSLVTEKLLDAIGKGITIMLSDSIFNYELDFLRRTVSKSLFSGYTNEVMELFRQFIFCWDSDSESQLIKEIINTFNEESYNVCPTTLFDYIVIDGKSTEPSDFLKQWSEWYSELYECIYE